MAVDSGYGRVTDELVASLADVVGEKNIVTGEGRENYAQDEMPHSKPFLPEVVVKPGDAAQVAGVMKLANERRIPVTPRGAGTGLSGGAVPIYGGLVISFERMNRILEIDVDNFTATVEAGVTLEDFRQAVEEHGVYYPLYPGEKSATIGGNVATNAGGMRAVRYGVTRNFVLGLEAVLPTGEIVQTGGKYVKCSSGYDLTQLLIGSEGTLALVTRVTLRLTTLPGRTEILFIPFQRLRDAIRAVPAILREGIIPVGIEFMERDIINMVEEYTGKEVPMHDYDAFLMLIVEAEDEEGILHMSEQIGQVCSSQGAVDVFVPGSERAKRNLLEVREKFYPVFKHYGMQDTADVVVPRSKIAEFVERVKELGSEYKMPVIACGHAGDGNVHLHIIRQEAGEEGVKKLRTRIYQLGISLGGNISGEHGLGYTKRDYLDMAADKGKIDLMKRIKLAFDPNNILNPGKVISLEY